MAYICVLDSKRGRIFQKGRVAEWLGRGLQNLVQRFESALDLRFKPFSAMLEKGFFFYSGNPCTFPSRFFVSLLALKFPLTNQLKCWIGVHF